MSKKNRSLSKQARFLKVRGEQLAYMRSTRRHCRIPLWRRVVGLWRPQVKAEWLEAWEKATKTAAGRVLRKEAAGKGRRKSFLRLLRGRGK